MNGVRTAGNVSLLVIPALFTASPPSAFAPADLQARYFDGPSSAGTLPAFFSEVSQRRFVLRGRVTPWVRTTVSPSETGPGTEGVTREHDYVIQALRAVDASVDFGDFDNDGPDNRPNSGDDDGIVDGGVMIVTAERGRHCGIDGAVWPHYAQLRSVTAPDSVVRVADRTPAGREIAVRAYVIVNAQGCDGQLTGIAIPAHELMHLFFRAPDMYGLGASSETQTGGARLWRTGCWDLMAAGSGWGCGTGPLADAQTPTHPNPWIKEIAHWLRTDTVRTATNLDVSLTAMSAGGRSLRFVIRPGEWYEMEYRQQLGYDSNVPASGVLIYHVNLNRGTTPPSCIFGCTQPPLLVEADNNNGLLRTMDQGGNRGEPGDAFGLFGRTTFSATTTPAALASDGTPTTLRVHSIVIDVAARAARLRVSF